MLLAATVAIALGVPPSALFANPVDVQVIQVQTPSPFLEDWETNSFLRAQIRNTTMSPVRVFIRLEWTSTAFADKSLTTISYPIDLPPAGFVSLDNTRMGGTGLIDWNRMSANIREYLRGVERDILLTGAIPEGVYIICPVVLNDLEQEIQRLPQCTPLTVSYPEQPFFIQPGAWIDPLTPTFLTQWTETGLPLLKPRIRYKLRISEIFGGQTAEQALRSNVPIVDDADLDQAQYRWISGTNLPLRPYSQYAFRVTQGIVRPSGQFVAFGQAGGVSPIHIATWGSPVVGFMPIAPEDEAVVVPSNLPTMFSWICGTQLPPGVEYRLVWAKLNKGQDPEAALESGSAGRRRAGSQTGVALGRDDLPTGEIVWRAEIIRSDDNMVIARTEHRTITIGAAIEDGGDRLYLNDFAIASGVAKLTPASRSGKVLYSGSVRVEIQSTPLKYLDAELFDAELEAFGDAFRMVSGELRATIKKPRELTDDEAALRYFEPSELRFTPADGLTVTGRIAIPTTEGRKLVEASGKLSFDAMGFHGRLEAIAEEQAVAARGGLRLYGKNFVLHFSDPVLEFTPSLRLFNSELDCGLPKVMSVSATVGANASLLCSGNLSVPLFNNPNTRLLLQEIGGELTVRPEGDGYVLEAGLQGKARVGLRTSASDWAELPSSFEYRAGTFALGAPAHPEQYPEMSMQWFHIRPLSLHVDSLRWDEEALAMVGGLRAGVRFRLPAVNDNYTTPAIEDVAIDSRGWTIARADVAGSGVDSLSSWQIETHRFRLEALTFDHASWQPGDQGGKEWDFGLSYTMRISNAPDSFPRCITGLGLRVDSARYRGAEFIGQIRTDRLEGCEIPLGSARFTVQEVGGLVRRNYLTDVEARDSVWARGTLSMPPFLSCDTARNTEVARVQLLMHGDGALTGIVDNVLPACTLKVAGVRLAVGESQLQLTRGDGGTDGNLALAVRASWLTPDSTVTTLDGSLSIDLGSGEITKSDLVLENLLIAVPEQNPTFRFAVARAELHRQGLLINGSTEMMAGENGEARIRATFNDVAWRFGDGDFSFGSIEILSNFAFGALQSPGGLRYGCYPSGSRPSLGKGLAMEFPANLTITPEGVAPRGEVSATVFLDKDTIGPAVARFSGDAFLSSQGMGGLSAGSVTAEWRSKRVALWTPENITFYLAWLAEQYLPDTLYLPTAEVAYIPLRAPDGTLLVDISEDSLGNAKLTSRGASVVAHFPALQFADMPGAPVLRINLEARWRVSTDGSDFEVESASVDPTHPDNAALRDYLREKVFVDLRNWAWKKVNGVYQHVYTGAVTLFGQTREALVELRLNQIGRLQATIDKQFNDRLFSLAEGSDAVAFDLRNIALDLDVRPTETRAAQMPAMRLGGGLQLDFGEGATSIPLQLKAANGSIALAAEGWGQLRKATTPQFASLKATRSKIIDTEVLTNASADSSARLSMAGLGLNLVTGTLRSLSWDKVNGAKFDIRLLGSFAVDKVRDGVNTWLTKRFGGVRLNERELIVEPLNLDLTSSSGELQLMGLGLQPLRMRTADTMRLPWKTFVPRMDAGWSVSFDFAARVPGAKSNCLRNPILLTDVTLQNGLLVGQAETVDSLDCTLQLPLAREFVLNKARIRLFGEESAQRVGIYIRGGIILPDVFMCDSGGRRFADLSDAEFALDSAGVITGSINNVVGICPMEVGSAKLVSSGVSIHFTKNPTGEQKVKMTGIMTLDYPSITADTRVRATARGFVGVDMLRGTVDSASIQLNNFLVDMPTKDPAFTFVVRSGLLDRDGFLMSGEATIRLPRQRSATVRFDSVRLDRSNMLPIAGLIALPPLALAAEAMDGRYPQLRAWASETVDSAVALANALRRSVIVKMPQSSITKDGIALGGRGSARVRWDGDEWFLGANFGVATHISLAEPSVRSGRITVERQDSTALAWVDSTGIGVSFLGIIDPPDTLGLPTVDIAFAILRDPATRQLLVTAESFETSKLRLSSAALPIHIPALAYEGNVPVVTASVDTLVIDPLSKRITGGSIKLGGRVARGGGGYKPDADEEEADRKLDSVLSLRALGIPVDVTYLEFRANDAPIADLAIALPDVLEAPLTIEGVELDGSGLRGPIRTGTVAQNKPPQSIPAIKVWKLGQELELTATGAELDMASKTVSFSGELLSPIFRDPNNTPMGIWAFATARLSGGVPAVQVALSVEHLPADSGQPGTHVLRARRFVFEPTPIGAQPGLALSISNTDLRLTLRGVFSLPDLAPTAKFTASNFTISKTQGIQLDDVRINVAENSQEMRLFGLPVYLHDTQDPRGGQTRPAAAFSWDGARDVMAVTLGGHIAAFDTTLAFGNLRVASDGAVSFDDFNLLPRSLRLVDKYLWLDTVRLEKPTSASPLLLALSVGLDSLPDHFGVQGRQHLSLRINTRGETSGGGTVRIIDEMYGIGNSDPTETALGSIATVDLTYLDATLSLSEGLNKRVDVEARLIGDIYIANRSDRRIAFGDKTKTSAGSPSTVVLPGLSLSTREADKVRWGQLSMVSDFTDTTEILGGTLFFVGINSFVGQLEPVNISFGGGFGIKAGQAVQSSLYFTGFTVTGNGINWRPFKVTGGDLSVMDILRVSVRDIAYGSDTTIALRELGRPDPRNVSDSTERAAVAESFFSFTVTSISLNIPGMSAEGSIDAFQYAKLANGGGKHILLDDLRLTVQNTIDLQLSFQYKNTDSEMKLLAAGRATVTGFSVMALGKFASTYNPAGVVTKRSIGLFLGLELDGAGVPILPSVLLTGAGGGFFYNPEPADLTLVRSLSGLGDPLSTSRMGTRPADAFAVLLYANMTVVNKKLVDAKVLITVTNNRAEISGVVEFLENPEMANGRFDLIFGWTERFIEGNVSASINAYSILSAEATLAFYVYPSSWALMGNIQMSVFGNGKLGGSGIATDFFLGTPGFLATFTITKSIDIWIVSVSGGIEASVWFAPGTAFGAYTKAWISAELAAGVASAKGWLYGALAAKKTSGSWEWLLYGEAGLQLKVLFVIDFDGSVYVAYHNTKGLSYGYGSNPEFKKLIEDSRAMASEMQSKAEAAAAALQPDPYQAITLSPAELDSAYSQYLSKNTSERQSIVNTVWGRESNALLPYSGCTTLRNQLIAARDSAWLMPEPAGEQKRSMGLVALAHVITQLQYQDLASKARDSIRAVRNSLALDYREAQQARAATSPLLSSSIKARTPAEQRALVAGGGGFVLDSAAAAQLAESTEQRAAAVEQANDPEHLAALIDERFEMIANSGAKIQAAQQRIGEIYTAARRINSDFYKEAITYSRVAGEAYGAVVDMLARGNRTGGLDLGCTTNFRSNWNNTSRREAVKWAVRQRFRTLDQLLGSSYEAQLPANDDANAWMDQYAVSARQFWYQAPLNHYIQKRNSMAGFAALSLYKYAGDIDAFEQRHARLSNQIDSLYDRRLALIEATWDLVDKQIAIWQQWDPSERSRIQSRLYWLMAKRNQLGTMLRVPTITQIRGDFRTIGNGVVAATYSAQVASGGVPVAQISYDMNNRISLVRPSGNSLTVGGTLEGDFSANSWTGWKDVNTFSGIPALEFSVGRVLGAAVLDRAQPVSSVQRTVRVRVRGEGGYTHRAERTFTIDVANARAHTLGASWAETGVMTSGSTPPPPPNVIVASGLVRDGGIAESRPGRGDTTATNTSDIRHNNAVWVASTAEIQARWESATSPIDNAVDLAVERQVTVSVGSGSLRRTQLAPLTSWPSVGGRTEMTLRGFSLRADSAYRVRVRQRGANGVWSIPPDFLPFSQGASPQIRIDTSAPAAFQASWVRTIKSDTSSGSGDAFSVRLWVIAEQLKRANTLNALARDRAGALARGTVGSTAARQAADAEVRAIDSAIRALRIPPAVLVQWSSIPTDPQSGVHGIYLTVSHNASESFSARTWKLAAGNAAARSAFVIAPWLQYNRPAWVHLCAVNGAGIPGAVTSVPIGSIADPTAPSPLLATAISHRGAQPRFDEILTPLPDSTVHRNAGFRVHLTGGLDPETEVVGYQMAVGPSAGSTSLKGFPTGGGAEIGFDEAAGAQAYAAGYPAGSPLWTGFRAIRSDGVAGSPAWASHSIRIDSVAPSDPVVFNVSVAPNRKSATFDIRGLSDAQTGPARCDITVYRENSGWFPDIYANAATTAFTNRYVTRPGFGQYSISTLEPATTFQITTLDSRTLPASFTIQVRLWDKAGNMKKVTVNWGSGI